MFSNHVNKMLRPHSFVSLSFHLGFHFHMISTQMVNVVTELMQSATGSLPDVVWSTSSVVLCPHSFCCSSTVSFTERLSTKG